MRHTNRDRLNRAGDISIDGVPLMLDGSYTEERPDQTAAARGIHDTWLGLTFDGLYPQGTSWPASFARPRTAVPPRSGSDLAADTRPNRADSGSPVPIMSMLGLRPVDGGAALALCPAPTVWNTGVTSGNAERFVGLAYPDAGRFFYCKQLDINQITTDSAGYPTALTYLTTFSNVADMSIKSATVHNGRAYIATGGSIYYQQATDPAATWTRIATAASVVASYAGVFFKSIGSFLYWTNDDYPQTTTNWSKRNLGSQIFSMCVSGGHLWVGCDDALFRVAGRLRPSNASIAPTVYDLLDVAISPVVQAPTLVQTVATDFYPRHNFGELAELNGRLYFSMARQVCSLDATVTGATPRTEPLPRGRLIGMAQAAGMLCAIIAPDDGGTNTLYCTDGITGWFGLAQGNDLSRPIDGRGFFTLPLIVAASDTAPVFKFWPAMNAAGSPPVISTNSTSGVESFSPPATVTGATVDFAPARWGTSSQADPHPSRPMLAWLDWQLAGYARSAAHYPVTLSLLESYNDGASWHSLVTESVGQGANGGIMGQARAALSRGCREAAGELRLRLSITVGVSGSPSADKFARATAFRLKAIGIATGADLERTARTWAFAVKLYSPTRRADGTQGNGSPATAPASAYAYLDAATTSGKIIDFVDVDGLLHRAAITGLKLTKLEAGSTIPAEHRRGRGRSAILTLIEVPNFL